MEKKDPTLQKIKLHDMLVGIIYLISIAMAVTMDIRFAYVAAAVAFLQIISPLTGYCPVYHLLNMVFKGSTKIQQGRSQ